MILNILIKSAKRQVHEHSENKTVQASRTILVPNIGRCRTKVKFVVEQAKTRISQK